MVSLGTAQTVVAALYDEFQKALEEHRHQVPCIPAEAGGAGASGMMAADWSDDGSPLEDVAKSLCETKCPVKDSCLQYALARPEPEGIWGGLSSQERRKITRAGRKDQRRAAQGGLPLAGFGTEELNVGSNPAADSAADGREREADQGGFDHADRRSGGSVGA